MTYTITDYTRKQAKKLRVIVRPSTNKKKKIDVFKKVRGQDGKVIEKKVASVGAYGMMDYPSYIKAKGKEFADKRRRLYKIRHNKDRNKVGTNSYYADKLLW